MTQTDSRCYKCDFNICENVEVCGDFGRSGIAPFLPLNWRLVKGWKGRGPTVSPDEDDDVFLCPDCSALYADFMSDNGASL